ncbi:kinetochore sim4 complex subunit FTA2 domain-containing protein [Hirsutella rhossiliensis]|uniref:Kinetochore sim4 complex subunit FTA2 domain-containing protein n=1 Tax=Hirsutella rhossiliensis TaxID=111463 RepID=A0A9P8MYI7_9HYPO|nr:kinetochore sim4 complex subunit FTA2 domain-containing protein [Hirsutella rhossiliensis]KAH0963600.1 kinetochore sim4 complex subunit FTA2 domain-containing protein [Hirsutella rhossiliensis]
MTTWHDQDGDNKPTEESQIGRGANILELGLPGRLQAPLDVLMVYSTRTWTFKTDFRLAMVEVASSALANASITWKDMLDDYSEPYSGHSEIMAHVFKVEIESKHYALKVFMPYDISYDYHQLYTAGIRCTEEELEWHVMPSSECRAYGRIKQAQDRRLLPHQVAVPCHGYIRLEEKDIRKLEDEWNLDFSVEQDNALKTQTVRSMPLLKILQVQVRGQCQKLAAQPTRSAIFTLDGDICP